MGQIFDNQALRRGVGSHPANRSDRYASDRRSPNGQHGILVTLRVATRNAGLGITAMAKDEIALRALLEKGPP
jgi:hypothetical protein